MDGERRCAFLPYSLHVRKTKKLPIAGSEETSQALKQ
jgi:hypothetical protein